MTASEFQIAAASLRSTEPVSGVSLDSYVKCRVNGELVHQFPEEKARPSEEKPTADADSNQPYCVRYSWLRSPDTAETGKDHVCHIHPDRPSTYFCGFWKSEYSMYGYPFADACHCSLDCFQRNWKLQLTYWEKAQAAKRQSNEGGLSLAANGVNGGINGQNTWRRVGSDRTFTPSKNEVGHRIQFRVSVVDKRTGGEVDGSAICVRTAPVRRVAEPVPRAMVPLAPPAPPHVQRGRFTVLTYNILADLYTTTQQFPTTEPFALQWQYRRQVILKELAMYDADIICLQEVQSTSFTDDLKDVLAERGYDAVFKKKTQEDMVTSGGAAAMDGCATFYKSGRFSLVKKYEVEFNKAAQSYMEGTDPGGGGAGAERRRHHQRLMKPNVALILVLEGVDQSALRPRDNGSDRALVCVANTHIHANQELCDVKLWQVHTLLKGLEKIANSANIPMVVAGDLNSKPGSAPHRLMIDRHVPPDHPDLQHDPLHLFTGGHASNKLSHSLQLRSAYAAAAAAPGPRSAELEALCARLTPEHGEPRCTNITHDFKETLDYIVCSSPALQPTALLELPDLKELVGGDSGAGLPNARWPSDHIALMAEFEFRFPSQEGSSYA